MEISAVVKEVKTIHTGGDGREDQPIIEITLETGELGSEERKEIKFTEMLSNLADKTDEELENYMRAIVQDYVNSAYKGQKELHDVTGEWKRKNNILGLELVVTV